MLKMKDISTLSDTQKVQLIDNLWKQSSSLWSIVEKQYEKNLKIWQNEPEWLQDVPRKRSKARDNRIFLAVESVANSLTGRPSKPNIVNITDTEEAKQIAVDLPDVFLEKYKTLGMKEKMRKGIRFLFFSRFICFKVVWVKSCNDFDTIVIDPRNVRVSKKATSMYDTEFVIEDIKDISLQKLLEIFPEQKKKILKLAGYKEEQVLTENPTCSYQEAWVNGLVIYKYKGEILHTEKHPYWDWKGVKMTTNELVDYKKGNQNILKQAINQQDKRQGEGYESKLYNYFDKPFAPYVFGTVLAVENQPIGQSSLFDQVIPLQEEIDKRKRQISDNAQMANGQYKVDTNYVQMTKPEVQAAKADPRGIWYGKGVSQGIDIMVGRDLPLFVKDDLNHSTVELDNIFGTQPTFRGEGGASETATGRAILREQSFSRLDELIGLIDNLHLQIYKWWYQMMRVRYTESNYTKITGAETAQRIVELTRNDFNDGMEIEIIPGQILTEDRLFKQERAKEEVIAGIIDPLTYFEETGRDNPMDLAKRVIKFKMNPLSILELDEKDMQDLQKTAQPPALNDQGQDQRAMAVQKLREEAQALAQSPEFQALPPDQQEEAITQIEEQINKLIKQ